jgi:hypothetical protein
MSFGAVLSFAALAAGSIGAVLGAFCIADAIDQAVGLWEQRRWEPKNGTVDPDCHPRS